MGKKTTKISVTREWKECGSSSKDKTIENVGTIDVEFAVGDDKPDFGNGGHLLMSTKHVFLKDRRNVIPADTKLWCRSVDDNSKAFLVLSE